MRRRQKNETVYKCRNKQSPPESAPVKRMVSQAKDEGRCIELNYGKRVRSVIVLTSGKLVLSGVMPQTIVQRIAEKNCEK